MYDKYNIIDLFLREWGLDQSVYVLAWASVGFGVGFLVGYSTKNIVIKKSGSPKRFQERSMLPENGEFPF